MAVAKPSADDNLAGEEVQNSTLQLMSSSSPTDERFTRHRALIKWVLDNNGYLDTHVQLAWAPTKGFHAVVADGEAIAAGTRIASSPTTATLSVLNALEIEPFSSHGTKFPSAFLVRQVTTPESLQAFFLMEQLVRADGSWWAPYISSLPTVEDVDEMQFENEDDLRWLHGTNLSTGFATQTQRWRDMFDTGMKQLGELGWSNALNGAYTWEKFRWATTMFGSRSFTSLVLDETLPADKARYQNVASESYDLVRLFGDRFAVLLPLVDIFNHRPGTQVEWQARHSWVGLQVLQDYTAGEELCNNYGPRDNEGLLLAYGFTITDNPFDHMVLSMKAPPGSPLAMSRRWKKDPRSDPEHRCFLFDHKHPSSAAAAALETSVFSFDLVDAFSVLSANMRELQVMQEKKQTLVSQCLGDKQQASEFEDSRNLLAALASLLMNCLARTNRLTATDPSRQEPPIVPVGHMQNHAKVYRDSQLSIAQTAVAVCKYILTSATGSLTQEEAVKSIAADCESHVVENLEALIQRHDRITRENELLSPKAFLATLPLVVAEAISRCWNEINSAPELDALDPISRDKCYLAVILSWLVSEHQRGTTFPPRTIGWLERAESWYPRDDPSWSSVPPVEPEEADSPILGLLTVAGRIPTDSPSKRRPDLGELCWAWNVVEEESVCIPAGVLGSDVDICSVYLYWEHC